MKVLINDSQNRFKGPKGDKGDSGTYSLEQIFSSGLSPEVTAKFINTIANDPQKRFRGDIGPTGPTGPSGSIANISELATRLLGEDEFKRGISGGIVKTTDFDNLSNNFNSFKTDVTNNYLKSGTADSTWWNTQLQANFGLYNKPEIKNDSTKSSPYVWNNFYTKGESDGKFALQTSLNNYYNKTDSDGKFALQTSLNNYYNKNDSDGKFALQTSLNNYYNKNESDGKFAKISQLPNMDEIKPSSFSVNGTKSIADRDGVQQTPNLSIFSNEQTGKDFVIQSITHRIGGGDISINPRWNGNVIIGYDKYGLNPTPDHQKDTNIPETRLAVKGDISASDNLIGKGLKVNSFENVTAGDKLLSTYIQEKSPTPNLSEYAKNTDLSEYAKNTDLNNYYNKDNINTELQKYSKLNNDATFNILTSNSQILLRAKQYPHTFPNGDIQYPEFIINGTNEKSVYDREDNPSFHIQAVTPYQSGKDIYVNKYWGGNIYVGTSICAVLKFGNVYIPRNCLVYPFRENMLTNFINWSSPNTNNNSRLGKQWYPGSSIKEITDDSTIIFDNKEKMLFTGPLYSNLDSQTHRISLAFKFAPPTENGILTSYIKFKANGQSTFNIYVTDRLDGSKVSATNIYSRTINKTTDNYFNDGKLSNFQPGSGEIVYIKSVKEYRTQHTDSGSYVYEIKINYNSTTNNPQIFQNDNNLYYLNFETTGAGGWSYNSLHLVDLIYGFD
jgi:hypothetical protein